MRASVESFPAKAEEFLEATDEYVHQGVNPGGYYRAVWARDASYILKDWFLAGRIDDVLQEILFVWSHQMSRGREKIVYGRGSPEMGYLSQIADPKTEGRFEGALPTTIFRGFSEVYGQNPDIDSTALMISTTAWILNVYLKAGLIGAPEPQGSYTQPLELKISSTVTNPSVITDFAVPRMLAAVNHLASRDVDGDGLLEQGHNEDWMDTVLRAGKIVYSQACWILALSNLSSLLSQLGNNKDAEKTMVLAHRAIDAVEQRLWNEEEGTYIDAQEEHHIGGPYKTLTQDVSLYLIAVTENTISDILSTMLKGQEKQHARYDFGKRANSTLDAIKRRIWKDRWPLVTEVELKNTGPWKLHPNQYHNHTFWPWTTGIEMLARSRFDRVDECDLLLSIMARGEPMLAFYEWVNPVTGKGDGAYPFRTGISSIRIAISDILARQ